MSINKSYTFTNNTIADPAEVNQNFDDLIDHVRAAHHRDVDGTPISYQDIASGWGLVPSFGIILWGKTIAEIPTTYVFCNGANSTPDLRNRMAICPGQDSGGTYDTGDTGGAATINISHNHKGYGDGGDLRAAIGLTNGSNDKYSYIPCGAANPNGGGLGGGVSRVDTSYEGDAPSYFNSFAQVLGYVSTSLSASQNVMNPYRAVPYIMKT